jgi:NAD(P)-dependent dehydrogenase (short-subunit alcohol dehydrogenase family)
LVAVRIDATGICRSDLSYIDGKWPLPLPIVRRRPAGGVGGHLRVRRRRPGRLTAARWPHRIRNRLFSRDGRLGGTRALINGASSGIGRKVAGRFAAEGARVACGGRDPERSARTVDEIRAAGGDAVAARGDVSTAEGAEAVVATAVEALGGLDALVSNAGVDASDWRDVAEWDVEEFDRILATNLRGPFLVARAAIPHMLANPGPSRGSIVHISSVCAVTVWAGDCAYDISKAGLNMLSDHIAVEYGSRGIRSNTLMPGVIRTELHESVMEAMNDGRAFERELAQRHPIGRFGTVDEVAEACVFLCAGDAGFLTGANISIDGGYSRV